MLIHHNCHSVYRKMSADIDVILKYVSYFDIAKYALIKIGDMLTILLALLLLLATNTALIRRIHIVILVQHFHQILCFYELLFCTIYLFVNNIKI